MKGYLETLRKAAASGGDGKKDEGTEYDEIDDKEALLKLVKQRNQQVENQSN
jgi:hypothetical protein